LGSKILDQSIACAVTAANSNLDCKLDQGRPQVASPLRIAWLECADGAFLCKLFGFGTLSGEVEDENLELAQ
jgi:hypothetical protein